MKPHSSTPNFSEEKRIVYGIHSVTELLLHRQEQISMLWIQNILEPSAALLKIHALAKQANIPLQIRTKQELTLKTNQGNHQGVIAFCKNFEYMPWENLLNHCQSSISSHPTLIALDGVTDPQNLGALIRSTYVLGGSGIIIPQDRSAEVSPLVSKIASGASELLPITKVTNLVRSLEQLKTAGFWIYGAVLQESTPFLWQTTFNKPSVFVLGSEEQGLRPLVKKSCDELISIPMRHLLHGSSLNVATCGALFLYEIQRQKSSH